MFSLYLAASSPVITATTALAATVQEQGDERQAARHQCVRERWGGVGGEWAACALTRRAQQAEVVEGQAEPRASNGEGNEQQHHD